MNRSYKTEEYSRILIEQYRMEHNSKKRRGFGKLVELFYDISATATHSDAIFLEEKIATEEDLELKKFCRIWMTFYLCKYTEKNTSKQWRSKQSKECNE